MKRSRKDRLFRHVARAKGTLENTILRVKLKGKITKNASKTMVGQFKELDRADIE